MPSPPVWIMRADSKAEAFLAMGSTKVRANLPKVFGASRRPSPEQAPRYVPLPVLRGPLEAAAGPDLSAASSL